MPALLWVAMPLYVVGMSTFIWDCHGHTFILTHPPILPQDHGVLTGHRALLPDGSVAVALARPVLFQGHCSSDTCLSSLVEMRPWDPDFCAVVPQPLSALMPPYTVCASQWLAITLSWATALGSPQGWQLCFPFLPGTHPQRDLQELWYRLDWRKQRSRGVCGLTGAEAPTPALTR